VFTLAAGLAVLDLRCWARAPRVAGLAALAFRRRACRPRCRPCRPCALLRAHRPCVTGFATLAPCSRSRCPRRQPCRLCALPPWRTAAAAWRAARVASLVDLAPCRRGAAPPPPGTSPPAASLPPPSPPRTAAQPNLAVAHLAVAQPYSINAVRPQPVHKHDDTGTPRVVNRRPPAQGAV